MSAYIDTPQSGVYGPYSEDNGISGSGFSSGGFRTVLGPVSTRVYPPTNLGGSLSYMVQTFHYMRGNVTALKIACPNYYTVSGVELGSGGTLTSKLGVEYPIGTFTPFTFSGSTTGSTTNTLLWTDLCNVVIPDGALYRIRRLQSNTVSIPYISPGLGGNQYVAGGDAIEQTATDKTISGTITDQGIGISMFPAAIWGYTNRRTIGIVGNSRQAGAGDLTLDATGDQGEFQRAFGGLYACQNVARSGEQATQFLASSTTRRILLAPCNTIICAQGINDIYGGAATPTSLETSLTSIKASFSQTEYYGATLPPETISTDNWTTTGNQSDKAAGGNAVRTAVNTWLKTNSLGMKKVFDPCAISESQSTPGVWNVPGYTADGVHETSFANKLYSFGF